MWELTVLQSGWQKTTIELFLSGVRALALQSSIIDVVRRCNFTILRHAIDSTNSVKKALIHA